LFSKWIAKIIQQNNAAGAAGGGADGMDGFEADNGSKNGGTTVVQRLENLLISRYNITLNAMMEEQLIIDGDNNDDDNDEEKKEEYSSASSTSFIGRLLAQDMAQKTSNQSSSSSNSSNQDKSKSSSAVQYANALRTALTKQHEYSLSYLTTLTPYEIAIAQNNCIDPSSLSITFRDVGGMDDIKSEVYDLVVLPLLRPDLFVSDSGLVAPPKGILLYG
jgi:ATP-dependent 26S proteasome regulatory subunit